MTEVARTLYFAPELTRLADDIVAKMRTAGVPNFNSLHLRMEKDAKDWITVMGGQEVGRSSYSCCLVNSNYIKHCMPSSSISKRFEVLPAIKLWHEFESAKGVLQHPCNVHPHKLTSIYCSFLYA